MATTSAPEQRKAPGPGSTTMNWSHIRRLSIVMRLLEDALLEMESALESASEAPGRVMTVFEQDISESAKPAIRTKIEELRAEIRDAKNCYDLHADTSSNRRRFSTRLSILAIDGTECRPQHMRGYGQVPQDERSALDERMSRLEALLNDLSKLL